MICRLIILLFIVGLYADDENKKISTQYFNKHFSLGIIATAPDLVLGINILEYENS